MQLLKTLAAVQILVCSLQPTIAQKSDSAKTAPVEVQVVDAQSKPRKGEQIVFYSSNSKKLFTVRSNAAGNCNIQLPAGDDYLVTVKSMNDTTQFGTLSIPALQKNQFYKDPFRVEIMYEPAKSFTLGNVQFDFGKATLKAESFKELNELADYLKWKEEQKVEIAGHTDNVGKDADNMKLSQQRAEAVKAYLLRKGIKAARVIAKGYGATQPVADNNSEEGRKVNRRTEVRLL